MPADGGSLGPALPAEWPLSSRMGTVPHSAVRIHELHRCPDHHLSASHFRQGDGRSWPEPMAMARWGPKGSVQPSPSPRIHFTSLLCGPCSGPELLSQDPQQGGSAGSLRAPIRSQAVLREPQRVNTFIFAGHTPNKAVTEAQNR